MKLLLLSTLVAIAFSKGVENEDLEYEWEMFKIEYAKNYESMEHEKMRKKIFMENAKLINEHNAKFRRGEVTFEMAINEFTDMTTKEFNQKMNGLKVPAGYKRAGEEFVYRSSLKLPKTVDWRKRGAVTPVKKQGQCSSCWAFSAAGSIEGQNFKKTKKLIPLSVQNLIDCTTYPNLGCRGGYMNTAFSYVKDNRGIDTEAAYPYEGVDGVCRYSNSTKGASVSGFVQLPSGDEKALQQAVAKIGPICAGIDARHSSLYYYRDGIYSEPECSPETATLGHSVLVVGYGTTEDGADYWLVKNSWGSEWGLGGYILMPRNHDNMCGIATYASYPTV